MIELESLPGRWVDLGDRAFFRLTGPDRVRYLNGQVSNNVSGDLEGRSVPACICNLKGKVEALVWITAEDDALLIDGEAIQRETILNRLERYLIADDCEIEDITGQRRLVHRFGDGTGGKETWRAGVSGRDFWLKAGEEAEWTPESRMSPEEWELIQVLSGVPGAGREITGDEFPAELGLDKWAVDFRKGCYLGQEVVSRIESVGKVKRGLRIIIAEDAPGANSDVRNSFGETGRLTRRPIRLAEKKRAGFGLFRLTPDSPEIAENQQVKLKLCHIDAI